jgi:hypothetical protein
VKGNLKGMLISSIVADRQVLFQVDGGMMNATMALFATYYAFMFEYRAYLNIFLHICRSTFKFLMHGNLQRL